MEIKCSLNTFKKTDVTFIDSEKAYISRVADQPMAVSYTHLDVYKRQVPYTARPCTWSMWRRQSGWHALRPRFKGFDKKRPGCYNLEK